MEEVEVTGEDKCSPNLDSEGRRERGKREERERRKKNENSGYEKYNNN